MATYQDVMITTYDFVYKLLFDIQSGRHDIPRVRKYSYFLTFNK